MLQSINGSVKKWIILPLFGVLILSFVAWGIADVFNGRNTATDVIVRAGDMKFDGQQIQAEVQRNLDYMRRMTGAAITTEMAVQLGLVERSIGNLVNRALLEQEAAAQGIVVSDNVIMQTIKQIPEFKKDDGSFDIEAFKSALSRIGANEQAFIADQRIALAREQLQSVVTGTAYLPPYLQKALAAAEAETRNFETYQILNAAQPAPAVPDDEVLKKYIDDHKAEYSTKEYRAFSLVRLTAADLAKDIKIDEDQAKAYYDSHIADYTIPETRSFQQVVVPTKEEAEKVAAAFVANKDFFAAARAGNSTPTTLNDVAKKDLPNELQDVAFAINKGDVTAPVQSPLGWHVLEATDTKPSVVHSYEDSKKDILAILQTAQAQDRLYDTSTQLDDMLAAGTSLEDIAKQLGISVDKIAAVDVTGKDTAGKDVPQLAHQSAILQEVYKLGAGAESDVLALGDGGYAVVRVDSVTPSALRDFADVKPEAIKAWQAEAQEQTAHEKALKLLADLRAGKSFEDVAKTYGAEATRENAVTKRDGAVIKYIPEQYTDDLFTMKPTEASQFPSPTGVVVVKFTGAELPVKIADAKVDGTQTQQRLEEAQQEAMSTYLAGLRKKYVVNINTAAVKKLFESKEAE